MKYKEALKYSMNLLAEDPKVIFIGYNVRCGSKANGTLVDIDPKRLIETPVAENLIVSMATGLAIQGYKPVIWIERYDFLLNAMDAIVNHLNVMFTISRQEYNPAIIIRTNIGSKTNPLYTGITHTQDLTNVFNEAVDFPVIRLENSEHVISTYKTASQFSNSWIIAEQRDLYDKE